MSFFFVSNIPSHKQELAATESLIVQRLNGSFDKVALTDRVATVVKEIFENNLFIREYASKVELFHKGKKLELGQTFGEAGVKAGDVVQNLSLQLEDSDQVLKDVAELFQAIDSIKEFNF